MALGTTWRWRHRQDDKNAGAASNLAVDLNVTMMGQHDVSHYTHTQSDTLHRSIRGIGTIKTIEYMCKLFFIHADALICNGNLIVVIVRRQYYPHAATPG